MKKPSTQIIDICENEGMKDEDGNLVFAPQAIAEIVRLAKITDKRDQQLRKHTVRKKATKKKAKRKVAR